MFFLLTRESILLGAMDSTLFITREVCLCGGEEGDEGRFWGSHMVFREKQSFLIDYSEELWEIECQLTARVGGEVDF